MDNFILCRHLSIIHCKDAEVSRIIAGACSDYMLWFEDDNICYCEAPLGTVYRFPEHEVLSCTFIPVCLEDLL